MQIFILINNPAQILLFLFQSAQYIIIIVNRWNNSSIFSIVNYSIGRPKNTRSFYKSKSALKDQIVRWILISLLFRPLWNVLWIRPSNLLTFDRSFLDWQIPSLIWISLKRNLMKSIITMTRFWNWNQKSAFWPARRLTFLSGTNEPKPGRTSLTEPFQNRRSRTPLSIEKIIFATLSWCITRSCSLSSSIPFAISNQSKHHKWYQSEQTYYKERFLTQNI